MAKFKVGDKVRFKDYTDYSDYRAHRGEIATITRDTGDDLLRWSVEWANGKRSHVDEDNMTLVTTVQGEKVMRKTYKLLKGTAELKVGALVQEKCDDGDQDFIVLDESFVKYPNEAGARRYTLPRQAVEQEPKWFVEVFPVEPQFMTREELDQFEAFKKREKSPTAKRKYAKRNTRP